jgi:hypothetical protein
MRFARLRAVPAVALAVAAAVGIATASTSTAATPAVARPHVLGTASPVAGALSGQPTPLAYHRGSVLVNPRIYLIFWDWVNHDDTAATLMTNFFTGAGGSHWAGVTTQYWELQGTKRVHITNPKNILAGVWFDDTNPIHDQLSAAELRAEAARGVAHFGPLDRQALYMVATPQYANDAGFNNQQYCAYHSYANGMAWANMPYVANAGAGCGAHLVNKGAIGAYDAVTMAAGHEYLEAVTDPTVALIKGGWLDATGEENADKCAYVTSGPGRVQNIHLSTGTFAVQGTWSNQAATHVGACAV